MRSSSPKSPRKGWKPIIPGESVNRYCLGPVQYIDATKDGINYKARDFYKGKRLLLRQTGGRNLRHDRCVGALTNQSVFTWKLRRDLESPLSRYRLEYILGVLNSRIMLYRYYMKSGDTEWQSFPRWTQELVQQLPIRAIDFSDRARRRLHDEIADRVGGVLATASRQPTTRTTKSKHSSCSCTASPSRCAGGFSRSSTKCSGCASSGR